MLQKCSLGCQEHIAIWSLAHSLIRGGCSKIGMKTSEAGTCTSQFSSYYWQRLPLGTGLREAGVESYGEVCTFCQSSSWYPIFNLLWATNLFSLPILLQLPLDFLSRVVFILCFTHPLLLPSVSPHLPSHHADCRPNQPWTSLGTLQN